MTQEITPAILAACGITCLVCYVHLRSKKACQGCRGPDEVKPAHCRTCKIMACSKSQGFTYCFQCASFPCARIKRLDKSYRQRYQVSLIENALHLQAAGETQFLQAEISRWTCSQCGGIISLHEQACSDCGSKSKTTPGPV